ncbi:TetR-like C-terminal domain-containing protein [Actinotalea sp. K2]|uniref:TetR-like C-terminal domain-containing protein n=1 Tax=Actinotalea sp. K2 TaxID=2939438 RepID=UPI0020180FCF|nr:TetR-like C-terminal domain-containing protein [Actinotalea sp. K2]MCL3859904.1 WHG domain-containing protein [Actinotalea sp. K2]
MGHPTARERARAEFTADLLDAARARLAADGAAALSLRAVARDLGVASSAVYRYVPSRDGLLTLLIIEAYDAVGTACEAAAAQAREAGAAPGQVWLATGRAFRAWALAHPHSFSLVYGTPVPGYAAPTDTVPHAVRIWVVIVATVIDAHRDGSLRTDRAMVTVPTGTVERAALDLGAQVASATARAGDATGEQAWGEAEVVACFALFSTLVGATTVELFGHLRGAATDLAGVFDATLVAAATGIGLVVEP